MFFAGLHLAIPCGAVLGQGISDCLKSTHVLDNDFLITILIMLVCLSPRIGSILEYQRDLKWVCSPKINDLVCPGCGNRIQSTDRFCKYCGRPVVQAAPVPPPAPSQRTRQCTGCGREVPEGLNFCPFCGKPTPGSAPAEAAPPVQPTPMHPAPAAPAPAPMPMPKCVGCGKEIPENLKFCPYCARPNPYAPSAPAPMPQPVPCTGPDAGTCRTSARCSTPSSGLRNGEM